MALLRPAFLLLILLTFITGGLYPLLTTALGQWWFHDQANGSLIEQGDTVRGSRLLGQDFTAPGYFHGRPSATADAPYNPMASGGSNLAGSNPELDKQVAERVGQLRAANPHSPKAIPVELLTTSASGLDGQLSPQAASWQIPRVAQNCQDALPMAMRQAFDESGSARRVRSYSSSARIFATISRFTFSQSAFTGPPR